MSKIAIIIAFVILIIALAACGGSETPTGDEQTQTPDNGSQTAISTADPTDTSEHNTATTYNAQDPYHDHPSRFAAVHHSEVEYVSVVGGQELLEALANNAPYILIDIGGGMTGLGTAETIVIPEGTTLFMNSDLNHQGNLVNNGTIIIRQLGGTHTVGLRIRGVDGYLINNGLIYLATNFTSASSQDLFVNNGTIISHGNASISLNGRHGQFINADDAIFYSHWRFDRVGNALAEYDSAELGRRLRVYGGYSINDDGFEVTLVASMPPPGQSFVGWEVTLGEADIPNTNPATFTMPGNGVDVVAVFQ